MSAHPDQPSHAGETQSHNASTRIRHTSHTLHNHSPRPPDQVRQHIHIRAALLWRQSRPLRPSAPPPRTSDRDKSNPPSSHARATTSRAQGGGDHLTFPTHHTSARYPIGHPNQSGCATGSRPPGFLACTPSLVLRTCWCTSNPTSLHDTSVSCQQRPTRTLPISQTPPNSLQHWDTITHEARDHTHRIYSHIMLIFAHSPLTTAQNTAFDETSSPLPRCARSTLHSLQTPLFSSPQMELTLWQVLALALGIHSHPNFITRRTHLDLPHLDRDYVAPSQQRPTTTLHFLQTPPFSHPQLESTI